MPLTCYASRGEVLRLQTQSLLSCEITSQGKQALFIQTHSTDLTFIIMLIDLPSGRKEKKPLLGSHFSCPNMNITAALIFRAANFFISGG